ncbi:hypothetical protein HYH03_019092 [Edaphochlamys debaryana]|uniref:EF-hand domain-containing protein n=1 Tax=Edaphochlamys debaryana TaxID=47281 RepID=A0A836BNU1_9CHLO|nr:hypothetical protein HYH03_019092 [Edaphochlamys debaryana]|eukprot:KAG2481948.1 hypothetical protein HYH03_019092 [Edaphochlamys debaryana]
MRLVIALAEVGTKFREVLKAFDKDGDNKITRPELEEVINHLVNHQFKNRIFLYFFLALLTYFLLLAGSLFGVTWAVVYAQKDTTVVNNIIVTKDGHTPLQLRSSDLQRSGNTLVYRASDPKSVATTATLDAKAPVAPSLAYSDLIKIKSLVVQGMDPSAGAVRSRSQVMAGVGSVEALRLPGPTRTALRFHTADGVLLLDSGAWFLEDSGKSSGSGGGNGTGGSSGALLRSAGLLGPAGSGGRTPLQASGESGVAVFVYGIANANLTLPASGCASSATAASCGAGYAACGSPPDWNAFATANFGLCEAVAYGAVPATSSFCC